MVKTREEIENAVKTLLNKYKAESAILFGSYARNEANDDSDIDLIVVGGDKFKKVHIFALGEDLREMLNMNADVFEISEVNVGTPFYNNIMKEGVRII